MLSVTANRGLLRRLAATTPAALFLWAAASQAQAVELRPDTDVATAGYYQLLWTSEEPIVLEEARTPDFADPEVIYRGTDNATVLSGKQDGDWYYRARTAGPGGEFGEPARVTVQHHPLGRAFGFFALGAVVFLATLSLIVSGARAEA